jgi:hypothetical protein
MKHRANGFKLQSLQHTHPVRYKSPCQDTPHAAPTSTTSFCGSSSNPRPQCEKHASYVGHNSRCMARRCFSIYDTVPVSRRSLGETCTRTHTSRNIDCNKQREAPTGMRFRLAADCCSQPRQACTCVPYTARHTRTACVCHMQRPTSPHKYLKRYTLQWCWQVYYTPAAQAQTQHTTMQNK